MANLRGQLRDKPFRDALRMEKCALENDQISEHPKGSLRWNAQRLLMQGDVASIKEIADRLDGKVPQALVGSDDEPPIAITRIERLIVDPQNPDSPSLPAAASAGEV